MSNRSLTALALVAVVSTSVSARADDGRTVAVVVASQVNASEDEAASTAASLETVLEERGETLTPWAKSRPLLPAEGLPADCLTVPSCIRDLGRTLGADELLFLSVVRVGSSVQVDVSWASATSGESAVRARVALSGFDSSAQTGAFRAEADRILPELRRAATAPQPTIAATTTDAEIPARSRHLTRGVWIAGGIGAAALVGAGALGLYTRDLYKDCERSENCDNAELDDVDRTALLADVLLFGGIAAGVTAAVLYYRSGDEPERTVAIEPTPGGLSLGYRARF